MTSTGTDTGTAPPPPVAARAVRRGGLSLQVGAATLWLSVIVLLPLAAILWQSAKGGWSGFWAAVTSNAFFSSTPSLRPEGRSGSRRVWRAQQDRPLTSKVGAESIA